MPEDFDPYYEWLGIPPHEQPPNHYRLLGVQLFEQNPGVIQHAADRLMAHLRSLQSGNHAQHTQRLLNDVSTAQVCLLNVEKKSKYDSELRQSSGIAEPKMKVAPPKVSAPTSHVQPGQKPPEGIPAVPMSKDSKEGERKPPGLPQQPDAQHAAGGAKAGKPVASTAAVSVGRNRQIGLIVLLIAAAAATLAAVGLALGAAFVWTAVSETPATPDSRPAQSTPRLQNSAADVGFVREFKGHDQPVNSVGFSADGHRILSCSGTRTIDDNTVRLWDVDSGAQIHKLSGHVSSVSAAVFSADGKTAFSSSVDGTLRQWDLDTGKLVRMMANMNKNRYSIVAAPVDGQTAVINGCNDTALTVDLHSWAVKDSFHLQVGRGRAVLLTPNGKWAGGRARRSSNWHIWDVERQQKHGEIDLKIPWDVGRSGFGYFRDSSKSLVIARDGTLIVWDIAKLEVIRRDEQLLDLGLYRPVALAVSPDGKRFLTGGGIGDKKHRQQLEDAGQAADYSVRLWDVATGKEVGQFKDKGHGHTDNVGALHFSSDGRYAVSGSDDATIRLWRLPQTSSPSLPD